MRRLPVYLLIDCSGSMMGEPIEAVKVGLQTMTSALRGTMRSDARARAEAISLLTK